MTSEVRFWSRVFGNLIWVTINHFQAIQEPLSSDVNFAMEPGSIIAQNGHSGLIAAI